MNAVFEAIRHEAERVYGLYIFDADEYVDWKNVDRRMRGYEARVHRLRIPLRNWDRYREQCSTN